MSIIAAEKASLIDKIFPLVFELANLIIHHVDLGFYN